MTSFKRRSFLQAIGAVAVGPGSALSADGTARSHPDTDYVIAVGNRDQLKTINPNEIATVFLKENGRSGIFDWQAGDYASSCRADRNEGVYISSRSVRPKDGAWVRQAVGEADIRWFGAVGDYETDDTDAVTAWLDHWEHFATPLFMARGIYRCSTNLRLPERVIIRGIGAPRIASFPQYDGADKSKLTPGKKSSIGGAALIFSDAPQHTFETGRSDRFSSISPCVIYDHFSPPQLSGFGIIQDMDVFDEAGVLTNAQNDNRASAYSAGFLTRATLADIERITVFGLFSAAGTVLVNIEGDGPGNANDPDYPTFDTCLLTGGVAIVGGMRLIR